MLENLQEYWRFIIEIYNLPESSISSLHHKDGPGDEAAVISIIEINQATFLSTRTAAGSKLCRYRWRMMA